MDKDRLIQELFQKVGDLTLCVRQWEVFEKENKTLRLENVALQSEIASLCSRLNMESEKSIIGNIKGWLVHDCWSSYFSFTGQKLSKYL